MTKIQRRREVQILGRLVMAGYSLFDSLMAAGSQRAIRTAVSPATDMEIMWRENLARAEAKGKSYVGNTPYNAFRQ
jgi:hypothetical protein